jgi:hypothetical protein
LVRNQQLVKAALAQAVNTYQGITAGIAWVSSSYTSSSSSNCSWFCAVKTLLPKYQHVLMVVQYQR